MKAVLLAAGMGTRLRPLTNDIPKVLVPISGRPLLDRIIERLGGGGVSEVIVVTGYMSEKIEAHLAASNDPLARSAKVVFNERFEDYGNFYSLLVAEEAVGTETFIRVDGDILLGPRTVQMLAAGMGALRLAVDRRDEIGDEEMKVELNDKGLLVSVNKQLEIARSVGEYMGIDIIETSMIKPVFDALRELIEIGETHEYYERAYERLARSGADVHIVDVHGDDSVEIDTLEDVKAAEAALVRQAANAAI